MKTVMETLVTCVGASLRCDVHVYGPSLPLLPTQNLLVSDRVKGPLRNITLD